MPDYVIHLEDGRLAVDTDAAHVDKLVSQACDAPAIAIHFHGGLVDHVLGLGIATRLAPRYSSTGAYPLFLVWEAGLLEVLPNRLRSIAQESVFRTLWERLAALALRKLGQSDEHRAAGALPGGYDAAPMRSIRLALDAGATERLVDPASLRRASPLTPAEELQVRTELERDVVLDSEVRALFPAPADAGTRGAAPLVAPAATLMDPAVLASLQTPADPGARGIFSGARLAALAVDALRRVLSRFWSGRDHGFHATIVEEILRAFYLANVGKAAWDLIKSNTASAFGGDTGLHGGTALIDALRRRLAGRTPRITLIGHSTGAIYISELLDHAAPALPESVKFEVVFLAAASTFARTADTLKRHSSRISQFRAFAMTDDNERKDQLVPVVYPHSLLYFVSGVLEEEPDAPIVGMQRYYTGAQYDDAEFPSIAAVRSFVAGMPARSVWSQADDGDGRRSAALRHGDFDNDEPTLVSLERILGGGFT